MNRTPDVELVLRAFFADDGLPAPDHVLDVVEERIGRERQRRSWRLPWRLPMNPLIKLGAAVVAVLVVAVVGYNLLPRQPSFGGPSPAASPSANPSPAATPAPIECEDGLSGCSGLLVGGPHRSTNLVPPLAFETTGGFWRNVIDLPDLYKIDSVSDPTPGYPYIIVWTNASITDQAAPCSTNPDPSLGRAAADWIELVTSHPGIVSTEPVDVPLNGITARQVELSLAADWTQTCPDHDGPYVMLLVQEVAGATAEYGLPADERLLLTVVNVGHRTVVILSYGSGESAAFAAEMEPIRAIISSFTLCGPAVGFGPCTGPGAAPPS